MTLYANKETVRKYYKYVYEPFEQPILTSNGTLGGGNFAVSGTSTHATNLPYKAFDGDLATGYEARSASGETIFYNPIPLCVTNLEITGNTSDSNWWVQNCILYGSNDGNTWTEITTHTERFQSLNWAITNTNYYKYYKITWTRYGSYGLLWKEVDITATQTIVQESTIDDYDFYEDVEVYSMSIIDNKYYAIGGVN